MLLKLVIVGLFACCLLVGGSVGSVGSVPDRPAAVETHAAEAMMADGGALGADTASPDKAVMA